MTTTINASLSGGLIQQADTSAILQLQTASTAAVTIDASQNITYAAGLTGGTGVVNLGSGQFYKDASGNVGIGTANPASFGTLCTRRGIAVANVTGSVSASFSDGANDTLSVSQDSGLSRLTFSNLTFNTGTTERMRITSAGDVLIGTTTASNKFTVSGNTGGTAVAQIINTTSSGNVISVSSTINSNGNNTNSAHYQGNTNNVGNWYLFGNGTSSYSSDERLKKNIETTRNGYLEDLCKLRVVKYNWRLDEEGKNKELGLIAQEVEQVFPNLVQDDLNPVSQDDDTIYKQLKQSVLPFMLLKAIQEQQALITDLTTRLAALEGAK